MRPVWWRIRYRRWICELKGATRKFKPVKYEILFTVSILEVTGKKTKHKKVSKSIFHKSRLAELFISHVRNHTKSDQKKTFWLLTANDSSWSQPRCWFMKKASSEHYPCPLCKYLWSIPSRLSQQYKKWHWISSAMSCSALWDCSDKLGQSFLGAHPEWYRIDYWLSVPKTLLMLNKNIIYPIW